MSVARLSWAHLGLVAAGGTVGTAARAALLLVADPSAAFVTIPLINIAGAFALGLVTGIAAGAGDTARTRAFRQFFGAGVLGGFTTYSTLASQAATLQPVELALGLGSVVVGACTAWIGLRIGRRTT